MVFDYADRPHERRHGPRGYRRYEAYKPWLRDEFRFRCIYCLSRERWYPDGDDHFSVDHLQPQRHKPAHRTEYTNLVYACCQCNASKQDCDWLANPCTEVQATHLEVLEDGTIRGLTPIGAAWIQVCRLDRPKLTTFRRDLLVLVRNLAERHDPDPPICFGIVSVSPITSPISVPCDRREAIADQTELLTVPLNSGSGGICRRRINRLYRGLGFLCDFPAFFGPICLFPTKSNCCVARSFLTIR